MDANVTDYYLKACNVQPRTDIWSLWKYCYTENSDWDRDTCEQMQNLSFVLDYHLVFGMLTLYCIFRCQGGTLLLREGVWRPSRCLGGSPGNWLTWEGRQLIRLTWANKAWPRCSLQSLPSNSWHPPFVRLLVCLMICLDLNVKHPVVAMHILYIVKTLTLDFKICHWT